MSPDDAKLAKIRKILAKAEDPSVTPEEAEAYNAKAAELIAAYGIDMALLAAGDPRADKVTDRVIDLDAPYARDKAQLLWAVAGPLRCKGIRRASWNDKGTRVFSMHLFGYESDLDRVELLFTSLLVQAAHGLATERVPSWENPAAYRRSWLAGFAGAVGRRLRIAEKRAQTQAEDQHRGESEQGSSVALVLADRSVVVSRAADDAYPDAKTADARNLSGSGSLSGYAAGSRADLGTTRIAPSRRQVTSGGMS